MWTIAAILLITIGISISVYLANRGKEAASRLSIICTIAAAALAFLGTYIVEFAKELDENNSIKEVIDNSVSGNSGLSKESGTDKSNIGISDNDPTDDNGGGEGYRGRPFVIYIGESHKPSDDTNNVEISDWISGKDFDLLGRTYNGGVKITIYNTSSVFDSHSDVSMEIISEAHYALDTKVMEEIPEEHLRLEGKFVVEKNTNASPSTAVISILVDEEEVYNSGEIDCYSANIEPFDIILAGKKELVIRTVCQYRGELFVVGLVDK